LRLSSRFAGFEAFAFFRGLARLACLDDFAGFALACFAGLVSFFCFVDFGLANVGAPFRSQMDAGAREKRAGR
jgi:hypothetical protein